MIVDSHCHAWADWPYQPQVPDPATRGSFEQLVFEMDSHGVHGALSRLRRDYGKSRKQSVRARQSRRNRRPLRLRCRCRQFLECDLPSAGRSRTPADSVLDRWQPAGFTHYLDDPADDGRWLNSYEGLQFFEAAAALGAIASIHCRPQHQAHIRELAARTPQLTILLHHMGHPKVLKPEGLAEILATARHDNVHIKVSGFNYATAQPILGLSPARCPAHCAGALSAFWRRTAPLGAATIPSAVVISTIATPWKSCDAIAAFIPAAEIGRHNG